MIDRRLTHVQTSLRDDLGRWAERRKESMALKLTEAKRDVRASGQTPQFLREQWAQQRASQLSIRKRAHSAHGPRPPPPTNGHRPQILPPA